MASTGPVRRLQRSAGGEPRSRGPHISVEIELKLAAAPADLAALTRALGAMAAGERAVRQHHLVSTYFDTFDLALKRQGANLRVRAADGRLIQTLKTADRGGGDLLARGEWEDEVAENRPDPHAAHSGPRLPAELADQLRPLFVTEIARQAIEIEPNPGTRIEAAIDTGEIRAIDNGRSEPVSEIELELKAGDSAAVYDLALRLLETAPLRIDWRSKSERGYRLVEGELRPSPVHAEAVTIDSGMSVEQVLQTIGRSCLAQLLKNEPAAVDGQPEGVHQMRVAVRRLRSLLSAIKKQLPAEERRAVADQLAGLAAPLGPARNLDVFSAELLGPLRCERPDEPGWDELSAAAERARGGAHDRVAEEILSPRHTEAVLRLLRWFDTSGWRAPHAPETSPLSAPIGAVASDLLDRRRRNVRQRSRHFARLTPKERHRLRIAVKKLRYTVELLRSLYPQRDARRYLKPLKPVQDELGHANDIRVAYGLVIELGNEAEDAGPIAEAGGQLLELHERAFLRGEPKLGKRLRRLNRAAPFWRR
ncbi:MAG TPA: CHAD domain-containing protein [Stellaceae bacterium]|jgi:inorganic triphosphatase YgiF|nr:CHAD domain-containing protein [Stellaceae bacterium]